MAGRKSKKSAKPASGAVPAGASSVPAGTDAVPGAELGADYEALRGALMAAAEEFADDAKPLGELLAGMVGDVERAARERLEIVPVCHHSPASAVHMVQRLHARPPRVVFMEMCEDLIAPVPDLADSSLPVALQAFAATSEAFPAAWQPLGVVAPLTELSAEYQAIAFALEREGTELIFVDRSVDHVFQALPKRDDALDEELGAGQEIDEEEEGAALHGAALGVEVGSLLPSFGDFLDFLLVNARVNHFAEWWSLYVEQPTIGASYQTYRRVMFLVGSLIRRLGTSAHNLDNDRMRERYMWTRMKEHLDRLEVAPEDAIYICGAAHAASDVEEFGIDSPARWDIPARTDTEWLYGLIPSSYSAIELQFGHPRGTVSLASETWKKAMSGLGLKPFRLAKPGKGAKGKKKAAKTAKATAPAAAPAPSETEPGHDALMGILRRPPELVAEDQEQLLGWCTGVVALARKNGYLASTADAIAIYQNALLLANLRSRRQPSPGDFLDAAVACLEKASVPGKRSVTRLCEMLLGADKIGQVGYSSLPPLVRDLFDRLAPIGVKPGKTTVTRALMDFGQKPALRPCSRLLWRLSYLLPGTKVARPIMGNLVLGSEPKQESWDVKLGGAEQRDVIQLAYEGVTVEQVLDKRLHKRGFGPDATTVDALEVAEVAILLSGSARLVEDIGEHAVHLLTASTGADDAQEIFDRVRRLVHYYRTTPGGLPHWLSDFVATGYRHYATLLPQAFGDRGTAPEKVAGMLAFVFTLESLALTLGCDRSQLEIAIMHSADQAEAPEKLGLLWAAEWLLDRKDGDAVRAGFEAVLDSPMTMSAFPAYLSGFLLAMGFTSLIAPLAVELLSRAFAELSDAVLMPWLPGLIDTLRPRAADIMPTLLEEAQRMLPRDLAGLDTWTPPWAGRTVQPSGDAAAAGAGAAEPAAGGDEIGPLSDQERGARALLFAQRAATEAHAALLEVSGPWIEAAPAGAPASVGGAGDAASTGAAGDPVTAGASALLAAEPAAVVAYAALLGLDAGPGGD
ncbi:DUF5682 family protein [Haliangium sp.]|uniref:DUF5682 family protein n=1 Tax=Haliangium sp. TaxID=2663208 RepID=UPI003D1334FE